MHGPSRRYACAVDWDWDLIVAGATLIVAITAVVLILIEGGARKRQPGLPIDPRPLWRALGPPSGGILPIEASNSGAAASPCFVVMHVDASLYGGNFSLAEQQSWAPERLEIIDTAERKAGAHSVLCVARNPDGRWWALAPQHVIAGMPDSAVPFEVARLLRRATGRTYACALAPDGTLTITPPSPSLQPSASTAH
jgi:hypothetical protein